MSPGARRHLDILNWETEFRKLFAYDWIFLFMRRVELVFKTDDSESDRKATCLRVLDQFQLPDLRLLCYFDDENPESLRPLGEFLCGLHAPVLGSGDLFLPSYVNGCFFNYSSGDIRFDNLVYLCGRATATDTG